LLESGRLSADRKFSHNPIQAGIDRYEKAGGRKPATINIGMILFLYNQGLGSGSKSQGDHWL